MRTALFLLLASFLLHDPASAAVVEVLERETVMHTLDVAPSCTINLIGAIETGDAAKLSNALEQVATPVLCLNSSGGSFVESLEMARLLLKYSATTVIPDKSECLSACAIVFMAGTVFTRIAQYPHRFLHINGLLTFSTPQLEDGSDAIDRPAAYQLAIAHLSQLLQLRRQQSDRTVGIIPDTLLSAFLSKPSNASLTIETIDDVGRWEIQIFGFREHSAFLPDMFVQACRNGIAWAAGSSSKDLFGDINFPEITRVAFIKRSPDAYPSQRFYADVPGSGCIMDLIKHGNQAIEFVLGLSITNVPITELSFPIGSSHESQIKILPQHRWSINSARKKLRDLAPNGQ